MTHEQLNAIRTALAVLITRLFWEEVDGQLDRGLAGDEVIGRHVLGLAPKE